MFFDCSHISKIRQKSSLNLFPSLDGSIGRSNHGIFLEQILLKKLKFSNFFRPKILKIMIFEVSTPVQHFQYFWAKNSKIKACSIKNFSKKIPWLGRSIELSSDGNGFKLDCDEFLKCGSNKKQQLVQLWKSCKILP